MKITKSNIEIYYLRNLEDIGWADISLDEGERSGRISISSDWGNWANYWGACGESFKKFLCSVNMHYFAGKVGQNRWFDFDATIKRIKTDILEARRKDWIEAENARLCYDELKEIEENSGNNVSEFTRLYFDSENLYNFYDSPPVETDINPQFKAFWEKAYKPFCEHLKAEMAENESVAA